MYTIYVSVEVCTEIVAKRANCMKLGHNYFTCSLMLQHTHTHTQNQRMRVRVVVKLVLLPLQRSTPFAAAPCVLCLLRCDGVPPTTGTLHFAQRAAYAAGTHARAFACSVTANYNPVPAMKLYFSHNALILLQFNALSACARRLFSHVLTTFVHAAGCSKEGVDGWWVAQCC